MGSTRFSRRIEAGSLIVAVLVIAAGSAVVGAGVVTLASQERSVDVSTIGISGLPPDDQHQSASDFGPFNGSVSIDQFPAAAETAVQHSSLTITSNGNGAIFSASSQIFHQSVGVSGLPSSSVFRVGFDVSASIPYTIEYTGFTLIGNGRYGTAELDGSFSGPSAPGKLSGIAPFDEPLELGGILQPGSYALAVTGPGDGANFDVNLALGTAAVPLPAAFWQALSALPLLALVLWRRLNAPIQ